MIINHCYCFIYLQVEYTFSEMLKTRSVSGFSFQILEYLHRPSIHYPWLESPNTSKCEIKNKSEIFWASEISDFGFLTSECSIFTSFNCYFRVYSFYLFFKSLLWSIVPCHAGSSLIHLMGTVSLDCTKSCSEWLCDSCVCEACSVCAQQNPSNDTFPGRSPLGSPSWVYREKRKERKRKQRKHSCWNMIILVRYLLGLVNLLLSIFEDFNYESFAL